MLCYVMSCHVLKGGFLIVLFSMVGFLIGGRECKTGLDRNACSLLLAFSSVIPVRVVYMEGVGFWRRREGMLQERKARAWFLSVCHASLAMLGLSI